MLVRTHKSSETGLLGSLLFLFPREVASSISSYLYRIITSVLRLPLVLLLVAIVFYALLWVDTMGKVSFES